MESIALMKPKAKNEHEDGLLEYLEDIIGTSYLKADIEALAGQVDTLSEERAHKLSRVMVVEKEKKRLEPQMKEAKAFIEKENELAHAQNLFAQLSLVGLQCDIEKIEGEMVVIL